MRARNKRTASEKRHVLILKLRKMRGGGLGSHPPPCTSEGQGERFLCGIGCQCLLISHF